MTTEQINLTGVRERLQRGTVQAADVWGMADELDHLHQLLTEAREGLQAAAACFNDNVPGSATWPTVTHLRALIAKLEAENK